MISGINVPGNNTSVKIAFGGNPLKCSCESLTFLKWLPVLNDSFVCALNSETAKIDNSTVHRAEYMCHVNTVILVFSAFSVTAVIIISATAYALLIQLRKVKHRNKVKLGMEMYAANKKDRKPPPIFLSFCSEDDDIIMNDIYPELEAGLKKVLQTSSRCVATGATDLRPGFSLANEIICCLEATSIVIFFMTKTFCKRSWCKYEALVAHNNHKGIVIMHWESVEEKLIPKHLLMCCEDHIHVHWKFKDGKQVMIPDWKKLCEKIVCRMGNSETTV